LHQKPRLKAAQLCEGYKHPDRLIKKKILGAREVKIEEDDKVTQAPKSKRTL